MCIRDRHISGSNALLKVDGKAGILNSSPNGTLHIGDGTNSNVTVGSQSAPALQIGGTDNYRLGMYTDSETGYIENKNGDDGIIFKVKTAGQAMRICGGDGDVYIGGNTDRSRKLVVEGTGDLMALYSTNTGAGGAQLDLIHDSSSYADDDSVGIINFSTDVRQLTSIKGVGAGGGARGVFHIGVRKSASAYNHNAFRLHNTGDEIYADIYSPSGSNRGAGYFRFKTDGSSTEESVAQIYMEQGSGDGGSRKCNMYFQVSDNGNPATVMTIANNKNVGIGTSTPGHPLHISESADGTKIRLTRGGVCEWDFSIGNSSTLSGVGSGALELLPQNAGTANEFAIGTAGSTGALFHLTNSYIRMPQLNQTGSTGNRYPLYWVHTGNTGSLEPYTGSVRAMKTDIADMGSVDWIHSLTPRSFKFRDYTTDEEGNRTYLETTDDLPNTEYGLIAEEVDTVSGSDYILDKDADDNLKGVLYHNLVPILLKSIQELKTELDAAKARITTLEG